MSDMETFFVITTTSLCWLSSVDQKEQGGEALSRSARGPLAFGPGGCVSLNMLLVKIWYDQADSGKDKGKDKEEAIKGLADENLGRLRPRGKRSRTKSERRVETSLTN